MFPKLFNMKEIHFKDTRGVQIMKFSEFSFPESSIKKVRFTVAINYDFFKARTIVESEKFDFEDLITGLNKIYKKEWKSVGFHLIEKQFTMRFDSEETGYIKACIKLSNRMFTGTLEIAYIMDQTFIPELIREVEDATELNS